MNEIEWHKLYGGGDWKKILVPDAFQHPAKVSYKLSQKIYVDLVNRDWLRRGDTVLDPFLGIGGFAFHAMKNGMNFVGIELEERFYKLAQQNVDSWNQRFSSLPNWGSALIINGDSCRLTEILKSANAVVSSPPYSEARIGSESGQEQCGRGDQYGAAPGNLGAMKSGDLDAVVSSPPYEGNGLGYDKNGLLEDGKEPYRRPYMTRGNDYGSTPGQLGSMPSGDLDGVISSPPYADIAQSGGYKGLIAHGTGLTQGNNFFSEYGDSPQNLGRMTPGEENGSTPNTFWEAARLIVAQCYAILKPGGVAAWVTKRYVKNNQMVEFSQQWARLCESVGFETTDWIKAWMVEDRGTQISLLNGDHIQKRVERYSFFRRLHAQKYPHLAIEWEDVIYMRK